MYIFEVHGYLTILILPICEHWICFHLFISFKISSVNILYFQCILFHLLSVFLSILFYGGTIVFGTIVNGIVFIISFSDNSLLVSRNTTNFCVHFVSCNFIEFISSNRVFMESLGFSRNRTLSSGNRDDFTYSFLFGSLLLIYLFLA